MHKEHNPEIRPNPTLPLFEQDSCMEVAGVAIPQGPKRPVAQMPQERHAGCEGAGGTRPSPRFDGADYVPAMDDKRLTGQILRVFSLMRDGKWRTLDEIAAATGDPHASISAQLRHLRKTRFGSHTVDRRARGERSHGLYEYSVKVSA